MKKSNGIAPSRTKWRQMPEVRGQIYKSLYAFPNGGSPVSVTFTLTAKVLFHRIYKQTYSANIITVSKVLWYIYWFRQIRYFIWSDVSLTKFQIRVLGLLLHIIWTTKTISNHSRPTTSGTISVTRYSNAAPSFCWPQNQQRPLLPRRRQRGQPQPDGRGAADELHTDARY